MSVPRIIFSVFLLAFHSCIVVAAEPDPATLWKLDDYLNNPPKVEGGEKNGLVQAIYYEGEPYNGKPTRVFAYMGKPEGTGPFPAVLLIHGGGGKAFANWADHWAKRGYVGLAMDLGGCGPDGRLADGGPNQGDVEKFRPFTTDNGDYQNMWTYQSIANILRGHALLLAQKEVDPNRIAATGISWGGYLTCILAGVDTKLKAAVPVYGCGFLHENSTWKEGRFDKMSPEQRDRWIGLFDPSKHVGRANFPMLFVNGTNDFAYPLDSYQKTYRLPKGPVFLSITVKRPHGHIFTFKEVDTFIDSVLLKDAKPLATVSTMKFDADKKTVSATFLSAVPIPKAELVWTTDGGPWQKREWKSAPATIDGETVSATMPLEPPTCFYLLLTDERGLPISTPTEIP